MIASITALHMGRQVAKSKGRSRSSWLACGAAAMGIGIWSMHFIAMLGMSLPIEVRYDDRLVLLSVAISVLASGIALYVVGRDNLSRRRLLIGGFAMGIGIAGMHYTGMAAMRLNAHVRYDPLFFAASVLIGIAVSTAALWIAFRPGGAGGWRKRAFGGLLMGVAIAGMHYAGMAATAFESDAHTMMGTGRQSGSPMLGFAIGLSTLLVLGISLVCAFIERVWLAQLKQQLERDKRIESLFRHSQDGVFSFTLTGRLLDANHAAEHMTGFSRAELLAMPPTDLVCEEFRQTTRTQFIEAVGGQSRNFDSALTHRDGSRIEVNNTNVPVVVEDEVVGVYTIVRDITERKMSERRMKHMAHHDEVTGLPNRRLFERQVTKILAGPSADVQPLAVLFLDIDRFKLVNDSQGHDIGDLLLRAIASRLRQAVGDAGIIARLGGDEFSVLLAQGVTREAIQCIAARINREIDIPFSLRGRDIHITASIGIALYPDDGDNCIALMKHADTAMYSAKAEGKNTFRFYRQTMNEELTERVQLENELRKALERGEFFLVYQPQMDIASGRIVGVEALIRWRHGEKGLVSPADFIPLAEETGMIVPIGEWVLRTACRQAKRWHGAGLADLRMSVNLSSRQFMSQDLADSIRRIIQETGFDPGLLDLEITESMTLDVGRAIATLHQLKQLGVSISIDDFGTGYSSLSYLKNFPVDRLKIDRSFISQMLSDTNDRSIVSTIIALAHNLNLQVVAEGVETDAQSAFLASHGCDEMQGYLISKPLPEEDIHRLVLQRVH
ncbi:bifunctional diguanylate cyclase/phosphodiesterase [Cohnella nanjingensis]|uniref:bifunctional diguanylate cyclase/phosphodiesterase n=1 Tax=Cohnella nanjingensis TaxID=1387779 RepID=UPI001C870996|nr:EAL domain-containing protein [Cohnella nanjingensis]